MLMKMRRKIICKRCKKSKEHHAKELCHNCYEHERIKERLKDPEFKKKHDEWIKRMIQRSKKRCIINRFGFTPKLYLYNKDITSDGCFLGSGIRCIERYRSLIAKSMILYDCKYGLFKIQVINAITNEEFWFKFNNFSRELVIDFFNKLKGYPITSFKNFEVEEQMKKEVEDEK